MAKLLQVSIWNFIKKKKKTSCPTGCLGLGQGDLQRPKPPVRATIHGHAVHIAVEATGGSASLIKNTQRLSSSWPGPKWTGSWSTLTRGAESPLQRCTSHCLSAITYNTSVISQTLQLNHEKKHKSFQLNQMYPKSYHDGPVDPVVPLHSSFATLATANQGPTPSRLTVTVVCSCACLYVCVWQREKRLAM